MLNVWGVEGENKFYPSVLETNGAVWWKSTTAYNTLQKAKEAADAGCVEMLTKAIEHVERT